MGENYSEKYSNNKNHFIYKSFRDIDLVGSTFDGLNLKSANFSGQDLTGSSFINCKIQGTIFRNAILKNCNFDYSVGGIIGNIAFVNTVTMLLLNAFLIAILQIIGQRSFSIFSTNSNAIPDTLGENLFVLLLIFIIVATFNFNSKNGLRNAIDYTSIAIVIDLIMILSICTFKLIIRVHQGDLDSILLDIQTFISRGLVGIITGTGISLLSIAMAIATTVIKYIWNRKKILRFVFLFDVILMLLLIVVQTKTSAHLLTIIVSSLITFFAIANAFYFTIKASQENNGYISISNFAINIASWGATNFQGSDLTNASFNFAKLRFVNFKNSVARITNITHISWYKTFFIDLALFADNYMKHQRVRRLLVERKIELNQESNFNELDLSGINLGFIAEQETQLESATFFRTNLSNANLEKANLKGTTLKQANLDGANLTGANLTGAYIEDWGITRSTKTNNIICEYVYTRLSNNQDPYSRYRIPNENTEGNFTDNGFQIYIESILDTLEVFHKYKVNINAVYDAIKEIKIENPGANINISGYQEMGNNQCVLWFTISRDLDKAMFLDQYHSKYNHALSLKENNNCNSLNLLFIEGDVYGNVHNIQGANNTGIQGDRPQNPLSDSKNSDA